jgi:hypothetical protein
LQVYEAFKIPDPKRPQGCRSMAPLMLQVHGAFKVAGPWRL